MRQQRFNEMLVEALEDKDIQQQIRQLMTGNNETSFEELKERTEQTIMRSEREMQERAVVLNELQSPRVEAVELMQSEIHLLQEQLRTVMLEKNNFEQILKKQKEDGEQQTERMLALQRQMQQNQVTLQRQLTEEQEKTKRLTQQLSQLQKQEQAAQEQRQYAEQCLVEQQKQTTFYADALRKLQQQFSNVLAAYNEYEQLMPTTKARLAGIVKADNMETFISCGVQYENIDPLWEFIKREIIEERLEDVEKLENIFDFFLQAHNGIYTSPLFVRTTVTIGELLDEDVHIRTSNSRVTGPVQRVYLAGYRNMKTNKIVKKSVVLV